jgi:hypothetical protein
VTLAHVRVHARESYRGQIPELLGGKCNFP